MAEMFTDADLREWLASIPMDPPLSDEAVTALMGKLDSRYDLIGPLTGNRGVVDDIPDGEFWSLVDQVMDEYPS